MRIDQWRKNREKAFPTWIASTRFSCWSSFPLRFFDRVVVFFGDNGTTGSAGSGGDFFFPRIGVARSLATGALWKGTESDLDQRGDSDPVTSSVGLSVFFRFRVAFFGGDGVTCRTSSGFFRLRRELARIGWLVATGAATSPFFLPRPTRAAFGRTSSSVAGGGGGGGSSWGIVSGSSWTIFFFRPRKGVACTDLIISVVISLLCSMITRTLSSMISCFVWIRRFDVRRISSLTTVASSAGCSRIGEGFFFWRVTDSPRGRRGGRFAPARGRLARCGTIADGGATDRSVEFMVNAGVTDGVAMVRSTGIGMIGLVWWTGVLLRTGANWDRRALFTGDRWASCASWMRDGLARTTSTFGDGDEVLFSKTCRRKRGSSNGRLCFFATSWSTCKKFVLFFSLMVVVLLVSSVNGCRCRILFNVCWTLASICMRWFRSWWTKSSVPSWDEDKTEKSMGDDDDDEDAAAIVSSEQCTSRKSTNWDIQPRREERRQMTSANKRIGSLFPGTSFLLNQSGEIISAQNSLVTEK